MLDEPKGQTFLQFFEPDPEMGGLRLLLTIRARGDGAARASFARAGFTGDTLPTKYDLRTVCRVVLWEYPNFNSEEWMPLVCLDVQADSVSVVRRHFQSDADDALTLACSVKCLVGESQTPFVRMEFDFELTRSPRVRLAYNAYGSPLGARVEVHDADGPLETLTKKHGTTFPRNRGAAGADWWPANYFAIRYWLLTNASNDCPFATSCGLKVDAAPFLALDFERDTELMVYESSTPERHRVLVPRFTRFLQLSQVDHAVRSPFAEGAVRITRRQVVQMRLQQNLVGIPRGIDPDDLDFAQRDATPTALHQIRLVQRLSAPLMEKGPTEPQGQVAVPSQLYLTTPHDDWRVLLQNLPHTSALDAWNTGVAEPILHGLRTARSDEPRSVLPHFDDANPATPGVRDLALPRWTLIFDGADGRARSLHLQANDRQKDHFVERVTLPGLSLEDNSPLRLMLALAEADAANPQFWNGDSRPPVKRRYIRARRVDSMGERDAQGTRQQVFEYACAAADKGVAVIAEGQEQVMRIGAVQLMAGGQPGEPLARSGADIALPEMVSVKGFPRPEGPKLTASTAFDLVYDPATGQEARSAIPEVVLSGLRVPLRGYEPGTADRAGRGQARGEAGDTFPPLVITLDPFRSPDKAEAEYYFLDVNERRLMREPGGEGQAQTLFGGAEQTLSLSLGYQGTEASAQRARKTRYSVVVVDLEPFSVYLTRTGLLLPGDLATGLTFAVWSNDAADPGWQFQTERSGATGRGVDYAVYLPPQGVGEAMEKGIASLYNDIPGVEKAIDFRYAPPARLDLQPPLGDRVGSRPPVWDTRRLFGSGVGAGATEFPGSVVRGLRAELLYGLVCHVRPPDTSRDLRVAELGERLGIVPGALAVDKKRPADPALQPQYDYAVGWNKLLQRYKNRLGVLTLYSVAQQVGTGAMAPSAGSPAGGTAEADLLSRLEADDLVLDAKQGVWYSLRPTARLRSPLRLENGTERYPKGADFWKEWDEDSEDTDAYGQKIDKRVYLLASDGLPGGVLWGVESGYLYRHLWKPKTRLSTSGLLARPALSALGGWGVQRAGFDNDLTFINADVSMGRTLFLSIERRGRIGITWNRARHVVVFKRQTVREDRYATGPDKQDPLDNWAVLRKTDEYVQIDEPVRPYPDSATGADRQITEEARKQLSRQSGFVLACHFLQTRIPVSSSWAKDQKLGTDPKGAEVWAVPLWVRGLSGAEAKKFPLPDVAFDVAGLGGPQCIDEVDQLYFYTRIGPAVDRDINAWPAQNRLDYVDRQTPRTVASKYALTTDPTDPDRKLGDAPSIPAGLAEFTFTFRDNAAPVNLLSGRVEGEMNAVVRNFTLLRAAPVTVISEGVRQKVEQYNEIPEKVEAALRDALAQVPTTGQLGGAARDRIKTILSDQRIKDAEALYKQLADGPKVCDLLRGTVEETLDAAWRRVNTELGTDGAILKSAFHDALEKIRGDLGTVNGQKEEQIRRICDVAAQHAASLANSVGTIGHGLNAARGVGASVAQAVTDFKTGVERELSDLEAELKAALADVNRARAAGRERLHMAHARLSSLLAQARSRIVALATGRFAPLASVASDALSKFALAVDASFSQKKAPPDKPDGLDTLFATEVLTLDAVTKAVGVVREALLTGENAPLKLLADAVNELNTASNGLFTNVDKKVADAQKAILDLPAGIEEKIRVALTALPTPTVDDLLQKTEGVFNEQVDAALADLKGKIAAETGTLRLALLADVKALCDAFPAHFDFPEAQQVKKAVKDALDDAQAAAAQANAAAQEVRRELERHIATTRQALERWAGAALDNVRQDLQLPDGTEVFQKGSTALNLVSAWGRAPEVAQMTFNRENVRYYMDAVVKDPKNAGAILQGAVATSPMAALLNRTGEDLKALGLRYPTVGVLKDLLPNLPDFTNIGKIIPDLGIQPEKYFPKIPVPEGLAEKVKITNGFDPATRSAWFRAVVDESLFKDPVNVFTAGPVALNITSARLKAENDTRADLSGKVTAKAMGQLKGDWEVRVGGQSLVTFTETALRYEENRLHFDLKPANVRLNGAVQFLADLLGTAGGGDGGFRVRPLFDGPLPIGAEAVLDLPPMSLSVGAAAVSGLSIGTRFYLIAKPGDAGFEFAIGVRFNLASKTAPAALTINLISGGAWLTTSADYKPLKGEIRSTVALGIALGLRAGFSLGPISGEVSVYFGIGVEIEVSNRDPAVLTIVISLTITGAVKLLGYIDITLVLLLEARYSAGGGLVGRGSVTIKVKICWCFTFSFSRSVEWRSSGSGNQAAVRRTDEVRRAELADVWEQAARFADFDAPLLARGPAVPTEMEAAGRAATRRIEEIESLTPEEYALRNLLRLLA